MKKVSHLSQVSKTMLERDCYRSIPQSGLKLTIIKKRCAPTILPWNGWHGDVEIVKTYLTNFHPVQ